MAPSQALLCIPKNFPENYSYKLQDDRVLVKEIHDEDTARKWLQDFKKSSSSSWTTARTYPTSGHKVIFKEQWKCHFNVQARENGAKKRKVLSKNLDCPALITVTVYRSVKKSKSKSKFDAEYPCHLEALLDHNHLFNTAAVLRHNRMSADTEEKLLNLFKKGYTASSSAAELVLVDASGNMDAQNHRVYILCTPGPPGGVPLGCIITDVEKSEVFQTALEALVQIFPEGSFYGKSFPTVIMTDDDCKYVNEKYGRRQEWSDAHRCDLPIRGNDTTNYVETMFRILKDCVFERVKAKEDQKINASDVTRVGSSNSTCFSVPSTSKPGIQHLVDAQHGFCSCESGKSGRICRHLNAVLLHSCLNDQMFIISAKMREVVFEIATGQKPDPLWLSPLNTRPDEVEGKSNYHDVATDPHKAGSSNSSSENYINEIDIDNQGSSSMINCQNNKDGLQKLFNRIQEGMETNPDVFGPAVKKLLTNVEKYVKTDSALVSALHTFGRYTGLASTSTVGSRRGTMIGVQPTSVARRISRKYSLGGKRRITSGRRPDGGKKPAELQQHDYTTFGMLPMHKIRARHNLQLCVDKNVSLPTKRSSAA